MKMELKLPPPELIPYGLRAFKTVAMANGRFDEQERELLMAVQRLHNRQDDVDAIATISPEELAGAVTDRELRQQLFHGMIVMAMVDEEASPKELEVLGQFADALGVDRRDLDIFGRLARKESIRLAIDLGRRVWIREKIAAEVKQGGLAWIAKAIASFTGVAEDKALVA
jgi:tellurite resistance protein